MPTSSQLRSLRHPHRSQDLSRPLNATPISPFQLACRDISMELADSLQSVIQTMLHVSPQQVLDPTKELFSPCTLSVPTCSMSAMFAILKNLNYVSANMAALCAPAPSHNYVKNLAALDTAFPLTIMSDFDIADLLQSVADGLSGIAAQVGVDLVLYHGELGMRHICVNGDENGISYALSHLLRQILNTAQRGDTLEMGLLLATSGDALQITFTISHKFATTAPANGQQRPKPCLSSLFLRRLLLQVGATLIPDLPPPPSFAYGRTCELKLALARGNPPPTPPSQQDGAEAEIPAQPSIERLSVFAESLKGKRVMLYASSKCSFAHHFTSYLTTWGMDVTHVSPDGNVDGSPTSPVDPPKTGNGLSSTEAPSLASANTTTTVMNGTTTQASPLPCFIIVDDDVDILKERLYALRTESYSCSAHRPQFAHQPQSSPHVVRSLGLQPSYPSSSVFVLHFTSLSNYKIAKDALQTVIASFAKSNLPAPEVMIIPKPAGPRRLLTALHTAVTKPVIDPFFLPIATAPQSPGIFAHGAFFGGYGGSSPQPENKLSSKVVIARPHGGRTASDRSSRSVAGSDQSSAHPPSPNGLQDGAEYFTRAAYKLGGSPSSGLVIQSPDGQPAGIFFYPRIKNTRIPSAHSMERDKGQLAGPERRRSLVRPTSGQGDRPVPAAAPASQTHHPAPAPPARSSSATIVSTTTPAPPTTVAVAAAAAAPPPSQADPVELMVQPVSSPVSAPAVGSSNPPTRRSIPRRRVTDSTVSSTSSSTPPTKSTKKKGKANENLIVPPISVLIVEDNSINQTILSTFMKRKGIQYDIANNGLEAVEKWKTGGFHLILMDIQMPVMDGIEATKEIRKLEMESAAALYPITPTPSDYVGHSPGRSSSEFVSPESRGTSSPYHPSVIIVALTASSLQSDRVAALAAGCNDFLTKPVSLLWLNSKIIEWGSIKALQMWADLRPNFMRSITHGQAAQARSIAERLHVPKARNTAPPHGQAPVSQATKSLSTGQNALNPTASQSGKDPVRSKNPEVSSREAAKVEAPRSTVKAKEEVSNGA
ncbi:hypothetical protein AMATHDRAFT_144811 [Amanita thiersii Skay4041]|uniref:Response regulatory domain-containing protein n=1 Tax=Amanita thiersii Skay4041 TaxID=703135 RepID=A0A2A9NHX2_9AGAR|nr:hypothetical protein AMATHDRAFT_144811 [Amanita thiersii Skay4041]